MVGHILADFALVDELPGVVDLVGNQKRVRSVISAGPVRLSDLPSLRRSLEGSTTPQSKQSRRRHETAAFEGNDPDKPD
jgi:hypothetical protein